MPQSYISQWQVDICKEGGRPNAVVSGNPCARLSEGNSKIIDRTHILGSVMGCVS